MAPTNEKTWVKILVDACEEQLSLREARLGSEYFYHSLPLCVIDAVFSIGVRYEGVQKVVSRYGEYAHITLYRPSADLPSRSEQHAISDLLDEMKRVGIDGFLNDVFQNRQRTSTCNGITKAEAVYRFARVLNRYELEHLQDIGESEQLDKVEQEVRRIAGQGSGLSWQYFLMLTGRDDLVKPDRMILGFLRETLGQSVTPGDALHLLRTATTELEHKYPHLTPMLLDHAIWKYQRQQVSKK